MYHFLADEHPFFPSPLIFAHRGASFFAPENTRAAFELAVKHGAQAFELDIQLSKDGELIVIHDDKLNRTTNLKGKVKQFNLDELQLADAGSWFDPNFSGERLSSLNEILDLFPKTIVNIEIKEESVCLNNSIFEQTLVDLIHEKNCLDRVLVSSFSYKAITSIKQIEPKIKTGLLYNRKFFLKEDVVRLVHYHQASYFHCSYREATAKRVNQLKQAQIPIFVYTVNDVKLAKTLWKSGISGFFTDNPKLLIDAFS